MKKFEYCFLKIADEDTATTLITKMAPLGVEGWELVTDHQAMGYTTGLIFKRELHTTLVDEVSDAIFGMDNSKENPNVFDKDGC